MTEGARVGSPEYWAAKGAGEYVWLWYADSRVWHERCLLWPTCPGSWVLGTSALHVYEECLSEVRPTEGVMAAIGQAFDGAEPDFGAEPVHRFEGGPFSTVELAKMVQLGLIEARRLGRAGEPPLMVRDGEGRRVLFDELFAEQLAGWRLPTRTSATALPGAGDMKAGGPQAFEDGVWFVAAAAVLGPSSAVLHGVGVAITLGPGDVQIGTKAVHKLDSGETVFAEFVRTADVDAYMERQRQALALLAHLPGRLAEVEDLGAAAGSGEREQRRTLPVVCDELSAKFMATYLATVQEASSSRDGSAREQARMKRNYAEADRIRDTLWGHGVTVVEKERQWVHKDGRSGAMPYADAPRVEEGNFQGLSIATTSRADASGGPSYADAGSW